VRYRVSPKRARLLNELAKVRPQRTWPVPLRVLLCKCQRVRNTEFLAFVKNMQNEFCVDQFAGIYDVVRRDALQ
jgi:hypothetical protein